MICFSANGSGPGDAAKERDASEAASAGSSEESSVQTIDRLRPDRPISIYSKKFFESLQSEEKIFYNNKRAALYKTELCRSFSEIGYCKYGNNCQFCHSEAELRNVERHPKYKTETCRTFWLEGSCPYGRRCCFAHLENTNRVKRSTEHANAQLSTLLFDIDEYSSADTDGSLVSEQALESSFVAAKCDKALAERIGAAEQAQKEACENTNCIGARTCFLCSAQDLKQLRGASSRVVGRPSIPSHACCSAREKGAPRIGEATKWPFFHGLPLESQRAYYTSNKYYAGDFEPVTDEKTADGRKGIWKQNAVGLWAEDPLNFIPMSFFRRGQR